MAELGAGVELSRAAHRMLDTIFNGDPAPHGGGGLGDGESVAGEDSVEEPQHPGFTEEVRLHGRAVEGRPP